MPVDIQTKILNTFNWNAWWLAMKMLNGTTLSDKLSGDSQIFQVWPFFNSLIIINLPFSQQEHVQIFPLSSPSKTCALPFNFALVRDPKNIFYYQRDVENYAGVCILMFMGLFNFFLFFKISLTESIISRELLFRGTCSIALCVTRFSQCKKAAFTGMALHVKGLIMAESGQWVPNIKISILLKKGLILLCQSILETRRITHLHGSAHFTIPLIQDIIEFMIKPLCLINWISCFRVLFETFLYTNLFEHFVL